MKLKKRLSRSLIHKEGRVFLWKDCKVNLPVKIGTFELCRFSNGTNCYLNTKIMPPCYLMLNPSFLSDGTPVITNYERFFVSLPLMDVGDGTYFNSNSFLFKGNFTVSASRLSPLVTARYMRFLFNNFKTVIAI